LLLQPKSTKENIPNGTRNLTMEKKMVHELPISFTHATPINHNDKLLPDIFHGKDLSYDGWPSKKGHPQRNLCLLNTLPRETKTIITTHDIVKGFNKQTPFGGDTPQLVLTFLSHFH
jgi:hypothetical protein